MDIYILSIVLISEKILIRILIMYLIVLIHRQTLLKMLRSYIIKQKDSLKSLPQISGSGLRITYGSMARTVFSGSSRNLCLRTDIMLNS